MKHLTSILFYLMTTTCFSQVEINLQQLRLLDLGTSDSNFGIHWGETSNNVFGLVYDGEGTSGDNVLHLREYIDATSSVMSFKANGRVGIGTEDPLFRTVIKATGNAMNQDSVAISNLSLVLEKGSNTDNQGIGLGFQSSSTRSTIGGAILFERTGNGSKGHLHFATKESSGADEDIPIRMTIEDFGNVGIGVTDPEWKTEIRSATNAINAQGTLVDVSNLSTVFSKGENIDNEATGIGFQSSANSGDVGAAIIHERTGGASQGDLHFATKSSNLNEADIPIRMTIANTGNVGIGTTDPLWNVVVKNTDNALVGAGSQIDISNLSMVFAKESNNNNEGVGIGFQSSGDIENIGAAIVHERTGLASMGKLHFATKTTTGTGDDLFTRLTISDDGNVGLGITSPSERLHVNGDARISGLALSGLVDVQADNNGTLVKAVSDARLKKDVAVIEDALLKVLALRGVSYNWKHKQNSNKTLGVIAQEVFPIVPELVNYDGEYYGVNYSEFPALLIEAIKEQQAIIEDLNSQLEKKEEQFASLLSRIEQLENSQLNEN